MLTCSWLPGKDNPLCYARPGYVFNYNISSVVTIAIPEANQTHAGKYACQTVPLSKGVTVDHGDVTGLFRSSLVNG